MENLSAKIQQQIEKGIAILKQGGLVAYPTDTVYGLGASAYLPRAVERIFKVKGRPLNMALPLLLASTSQLTEVAESVPEIVWRLIERFWPGGLTLVLHKAKSVPDIITAGGTTIALRIPDHPIPIALIEGLGSPIVGTSANLSGQPSPLTADEVRAQLGDRIDLIIDGGRCPWGKESTIVDLTGPLPVILREGTIPRAELEQVFGKVELKKGEQIMRIAIGSDHRGLELKQSVIKLITEAGHSIEDLGTYTTESVDYPDIAQKVGEAVARGDFDRGILICGTGIGMCIASNKVKGIRVALCHNAFGATRARQHNDANILCLSGEEGAEDLPAVIKTFLNTRFEGGRHQRRVEKISQMEG